MGLFIDCHLLLEVQLLCSSLYIEFSSIEDSKWSRGRQKMECQVEKLEYFRHVLLFEFKRGANQKRRPETFAPCVGTIPQERARQENDFSRFKEARFDINDTPRSGRTSGFHEDRLNTLIHNDPRQGTRELANVMICDHFTIVRHLHSMGKVQNMGVWVPRALSQNHKNQQVAICASLLARHREQHRPCLSCIVSDDEKWYLYANIRKRKEWLNPKKRRICRKCSNFSAWHSIFQCSWLHYPQMTELQYVNSRTTIEFQIKNDNR